MSTRLSQILQVHACMHACMHTHTHTHTKLYAVAHSFLLSMCFFSIMCCSVNYLSFLCSFSS